MTVSIINLNPCLDKTLFFPALPTEGIHTASKVTLLTGGKGANCARVLRTLGTSCRLWMPVAGEVGALCRRLLAEEGLDAECVPVSGMTREIITLAGRDWRQLAVKEPGPSPDSREAADITANALDFAAGADLLAICGGASCDTLASLPAVLIAAAKQRHIPVLLDASGETLRRGLAARPDYAKPNLEEACALGAPPDPVQALRWLSQWAETPLLSLGKEGLLTPEAGSVLQVKPPEVCEVNPVGCGDSFVAGFLHGLASRRPFRDCLALGTACGAANATVWEAAGVETRRVSALLPKVSFAVLCA